MDRVLDEAGVVPTPDAQIALIQLPDTFKEWIAGRAACSLSRWPWRAVSFIGSHKGVRERVLDEEGCIPTKKARIALAGMPYRFLDWLAAETAPAAGVHVHGHGGGPPTGMAELGGQAASVIGALTEQLAERVPRQGGS